MASLLVPREAWARIATLEGAVAEACWPEVAGTTDRYHIWWEVSPVRRSLAVAATVRSIADHVEPCLVAGPIRRDARRAPFLGAGRAVAADRDRLRRRQCRRVAADRPQPTGQGQGRDL